VLLPQQVEPELQQLDPQQVFASSQQWLFEQQIWSLSHTNDVPQHL
jgi:hypothetical protein